MKIENIVIDLVWEWSGVLWEKLWSEVRVYIGAFACDKGRLGDKLCERV